MLAKMQQQTDTSPQSEASLFRNKLTVFSLVLILGIGISAGYMMFTLLQPATPVNVKISKSNTSKPNISSSKTSTSGENNSSGN